MSVNSEWQQTDLAHEAGELRIGRRPHPHAPCLVVNDPHVSREQLLLEEFGVGLVRVESLSQVPAQLADGSVLASGESRVVKLPLRLTVGMSQIEVRSEDGTASAYHTIQTPKSTVLDDPLSSLTSLGESPPPERMAQWFEGLVAVQRAAAGSSEFYTETARAVVELIGLDRGIVLLRRAENWEVAAVYPPQPLEEVEYSRAVLARLLTERRTWFEAFEDRPPSVSLAGVESVVASPVFDSQEKVIGVVYGLRRARSTAPTSGIHALEAQVVQVLAGAVSAGFARLESEAEAVRTRVQFEQFFSPEVVRELELDPALLEAQEREVTVLFSDIRRYSSLAERLGARESYRLLQDIMDALTEQVSEHGGVIIDYYGDGLAAMWNAPVTDVHHRISACRAGQAMLAAVPALNETWAERIGEAIEIGIGVNTGPAQVGNAGSRKVFKYGPLGHTVNLASRVEGATRHFGVPMIVTSAVCRDLPADLATRRLARVRAVGMADPVDVLECVTTPSDAWRDLRAGYESALSACEAGNVEEGARIAKALVGSDAGRDDAALAELVKRIEAAAAANDGWPDVWDMKSK